MIQYIVKINVECAPMAGYTGYEFRRVLARCGARVIWTEMISAAALFYKNKKTIDMLKFDRDPDVKTVVQLFGHDPKHFESAIKFLHENGYFGGGGFAEVNINMGCPANKIVKNNEGSALLKKPERAREIIRMCVATSPVPVSVKMRLDNVMEIAKICESENVARIIVHGRFAAQGYSGTADWSAIAAVVRAVKIPVVANGDVRSLADARRCLDETGASGVMVGRALLSLFRKYFPQKLQTLRSEKIQKQGDGDFGNRDIYKCEFFPCGCDGEPGQ